MGAFGHDSRYFPARVCFVYGAYRALGHRGCGGAGRDMPEAENVSLRGLEGTRKSPLQQWGEGGCKGLSENESYSRYSSTMRSTLPHLPKAP